MSQVPDLLDNINIDTFTFFKAYIFRSFEQIDDLLSFIIWTFFALDDR